MNLGGLNYVAVLLAAVASFLFGGLWYGALSKPWLAAIESSEDDLRKRQASVAPFVIAVVAQIVMAWMLAGVLLHLARGGLTINFRAGMISGFFLWLGFVVTTLATNHAFQGARRQLTLIDGGHWLGVLLIQGAILGWFGA
ncbi:MAG: DUF1761 domain-containing protein [Hyphomicrobiaceae bacterium]